MGKDFHLKLLYVSREEYPQYVQIQSLQPRWGLISRYSADFSRQAQSFETRLQLLCLESLFPPKGKNSSTTLGQNELLELVDSKLDYVVLSILDQNRHEFVDYLQSDTSLALLK